MPNVTVEDVFGKNSSAIKAYGTVTATKGDCTTDINAKKLNWTIGTMTPGETVTLTYQAVIKEEAWSGTTNNGTDDNTSVSLEIQNNAAVKSDGVQYDSVTQNTTTLKKTWIEKVANVQNNGDRITFTITANSDQNNAPLLSNILTFTDALTGSYKYDGSLTVNCYTSSASTTPVKTKEIPISEILDEALQNPGRWICQRRHMKIFRDSTTMC
jgi:hypothetical protein